MRALIIAFVVVTTANAFGVGVQSYKDWKQEKIQNANFQLIATKAQIQSLKQHLAYQDYNRNQRLQTLQSLANQLEWNLEVAQDLSVKDYLVLYLAGQKDEKRFTKAAARLTVQETAEVLEAYTKAMDDEKIKSTNGRLSNQMPFSK